MKQQGDVLEVSKRGERRGSRRGAVAPNGCDGAGADPVVTLRCSRGAAARGIDESGQGAGDSDGTGELTGDPWCVSAVRRGRLG